MKFLCLVEKKNESMEMVVCLNLLLCPYYIRTIFSQHSVGKKTLSIKLIKDDILLK